MSKKGCCSCNVTSCCAAHNYTNNVAMIGDLLVDDEFKINLETGELELDEKGDPILIEKCQVVPVHKDDELILFQKPYEDGIFGDNSTRVYNNGTSGQCKCFYGYSNYKAQRTRTIRQKYKYTGCSWTWYPPKYLFNYDSNIPQCGIAAENNPLPGTLDFNVNCFEFTQGFGKAGNISDGFASESRTCPLCTQINPMMTNSDLVDSNGNNIFNIWGDVNTAASPPVSPYYGILPVEGGNGWLTQFTSSLYPGHGSNLGYECCTCTHVDEDDATVKEEAGTSCWRRASVPQIPGECQNLNYVRNNTTSPPLYQNKGIFYSTFKNRQNGRLASGNIFENQTFIMGEGTEPAYFVNNKNLSIKYIPSKGGYSQNNCTYCSLSEYLRNLSHDQYPWAFDLFCAGGSRSSSAKTYNFPTSFIKTGMWNLDSSSASGGLKQEGINTGTTEADAEMEQWTEVLGEHTFYSQLVGMVQLEHYWEYTGVNKNDLDAAVKTIPYGLVNNANVQDRWNYWKQRTTPRMFVLKSSATPLFTFDLVYADRLGIFKAFADPDGEGAQPGGGTVDPPTMTIAKFLAYFSTFSNSYTFLGKSPIDPRGRAQFPPGCDDGYKHVGVVKEILDAMCEAGIIGTRDHRQAIYNEIKQIIETGIENGRNGAYYKPWAPGNPVFVTPSDFDKLKAKYYDAYNGKMCTPQEMFPEKEIKGLGLFGPIRKIIPPSYLTFPDLNWDSAAWKNSHDGEDPPAQPPFVYVSNAVDPDDIFNEANIPVINCRSGGVLGNQIRKRKIQNLQFSKYYGNGYYNPASPDYVNSQLFFRAIPGRWSIVKWASLTTRTTWCNRTSSPCSTFEIYGVGPAQTGEPGYLWHSEGVRTTLYNYGNPLLGNGYPGMCNGINPKVTTPRIIPGSPQNANCGDSSTDQINTQMYRTTNPYCGFESYAWDASGAPSTVRCTPACTPPDDNCCNTNVFFCGCECAGTKDCARQNILVNGNSDWSPTLPCSQLFGESCCECLGVNPNTNLTIQEYTDLLTGPQRKCETCAEDCNFGCPEIPPSPLTANNINSIVKNEEDLRKLLGPESVADDRDYIFKGLPGGGGAGGGGENGGAGGGGGQNPCEVTGCDNIEASPQLGVGACDPNCGYNGFAYDKLGFVLQQNNYNWSRTIISDQGIDCPICTCSGFNTCYVRFAGKVQNYLPNTETGFYEPQEDPDGNLFDTGYVNMGTPVHLLPTSIDGGAGRAAITWLQCGTGCQDPASQPCLCSSPVNFKDLLCPGAIVKAYTLSMDCQNPSNRWCGFYRSGRVILDKIKVSDVIDENYQYV